MIDYGQVFIVFTTTLLYQRPVAVQLRQLLGIHRICHYLYQAMSMNACILHTEYYTVLKYIFICYNATYDV